MPQLSPWHIIILEEFTVIQLTKKMSATWL